MEETISLKEILSILKKRILLIVGLTVGAILVSALVSFFMITPTYESSTQFIVNQETNEANVVDYNQIRSNVEIINTYNDIIKSNRILSQVVEELDLAVSANQLGQSITVSSGQNSQVVTLTASDTDPDRAVEIANTTVQIFQNDLPELMNVNNVNILTEAMAAADPTPVSPKPLLNIAIAMVVGLMAGVGLAFLLEYLDNTIKDEQDIENKLELPILGVIAHVADEDTQSTRASQNSPRRERGSMSGQRKKTV
ncbi:Capsular polysaccharide biosynthesis protein [Gracilibacillus ureilyticus]|uniref:Capsular polysaccharide biosynthesis protein n=1 Tax=Gracilibacillus ureilyticus TaxID=531814 RepID=A0A1H9RB28_9BACI|nr:Wzz/FepE/Etk N-terminal domain-containing protein [Gracilibacillus ureilyticus]SER69922.1 Capsular polysaccharide biosynthesis protein [Gracilibacillus ureilyticus]